MTETRRNAHPGACTRCGSRVAPDAGTLRRVEREDGAYRWANLTHDECPEEGAGAGPEVPRWALYDHDGLTPAGNQSRGVRLVDGARSAGDSVPVNAAAVAAVTREAGE